MLRCLKLSGLPRTKMNQTINNLMVKIVKNKLIRRVVVFRSHMWFFMIYFHHYIHHPTAGFQKEIFAISEDETIKQCIIVAFRGSGKSTIMSLSYPLWAILGKPQKRFVLILSQTQAQARQIMANLKAELESNGLLKTDLGPFEDESSEWNLQTIVLKKYNARIAVASTEQSIRGTRHKEYRPDLIICDDIEDLNSVKTQEGRDKTYNWLMGDVLPTGSTSTVLVVVGNLLHEDSCVMRLKKNIENYPKLGVFRSYPLIKDNGEILWPGKYPGEQDILRLRQSYDPIAFQREFMLRIVPPDTQIVRPEWLHYYNELPPEDECSLILISVDPAITEKDSADYTAIIVAKIYGPQNNRKFYILPVVINRRLGFPKLIKTIKDLTKQIRHQKGKLTIVVEGVSAQEYIVQHLADEGYPVKGHRIKEDKRSRLMLITNFLQQGGILFPKNGCELLIRQMLYFGAERYDDLVDALTLLIDFTVRTNPEKEPGIYSFYREEAKELEFKKPSSDIQGRFLWEAMARLGYQGPKASEKTAKELKKDYEDLESRNEGN